MIKIQAVITEAIRTKFQRRRIEMERQREYESRMNEPRQTKDQTKVDNMQATGLSQEEGDVAYDYLKDRAPRLHQYIKHDAPVPIDPVETIKMFKQHGEDRTLTMFKQHLENDARTQYGQGFPGA